MAMYLDYFSLDRHPFRITPDPSLFFPGGQDGRGVILNALVYGITSGEGILKVVGEVGSGKTMLCRMLEEKLPESVEIVYIANPSLSAREILYAIAIELKLDVTAATERLRVMHLLQDYLLARHSQGGTVVVFIEEAQSMPLETLEEIRLLSNLETHQHKLMQIVLFGQPELDKILAQKNIRQLRERITHSFRLEPLTTQATGDYLRYRLKVAGCPRAHLFSARAEKMIASASSGLTRRINILADKSLLAAYADSPSRQPPQDSDEPLVLPRHVKAAIRDSDYRRSGISPWLTGGLSTSVLILAVIAVMTLNLVPGGNDVSVPGGVNALTPDAQAPQQPESVPAAAQQFIPEATAANVPANELPEASIAAPLDTQEADITDNASVDQPDAGITLALLDSTGAVDAGVETLTDVPAPATEFSTGDVSADVRAVDDQVSLAVPVTVLPAGLTELRMDPTAAWLQELDNRNGYTIQLFSVPSTNPNGLEEYLQFLQLVSLLDETYICFMPVSSPTSGRWQVMHSDFQGVTPARNFIDSLPTYIRQFGPYVRNLNGIDCSYPVDTRD